jgi:hypothetical protein
MSQTVITRPFPEANARRLKVDSHAGRRRHACQLLNVGGLVVRTRLEDPTQIVYAELSRDPERCWPAAAESRPRATRPQPGNHCRCHGTLLRSARQPSNCTFESGRSGTRWPDQLDLTCRPPRLRLRTNRVGPTANRTVS